MNDSKDASSLDVGGTTPIKVVVTTMRSSLASAMAELKTLDLSIDRGEVT